jgi:putative sterol carrier protein
MGIQESEIDWESPVEPEVGQITDADVAVYRKALGEMGSIIAEMNKNERARKDIAGWKRDILVKTRGGRFSIAVDNGSIKLEEEELVSPDFVMVCKDPHTILDGLAYRGALTDAVINKKLWISKNLEFNTIFKLDRMARSVARSKKV